MKSTEEKSAYLSDLFKNTYLNDIVERNKIQREDILETIINMLSSSVGSLTNPKKLCDTFISNGYTEVNRNTINSYINYLQDAFLINKTQRYEFKILAGQYLNTGKERTEVRFLQGTSGISEAGYEIPEAFNWYDKDGNKVPIAGYWVSKYTVGEAKY